MRYTCCFLLLFPFFTILSAQTTQTAADTIYPARFKGGFLLGLHAAQPNGKGSELSIRPHFGYFVQFPLKKQNSLEVGFLVRWTGRYDIKTTKTEITQDEQGRPGSAEWHCAVPNIVFLEFPVLLQHRFLHDKFSIFGGTSPAVVIPRGPVGISVSGYRSEAPLKSYTLRQGIHRFDLGLTGGFRFHVAPRLQFDLRINYGLFDISNDAFFNQNIEHRNTNLQVSMRRYFFNVKP